MNRLIRPILATGVILYAPQTIAQTADGAATPAAASDPSKSPIALVNVAANQSSNFNFSYGPPSSPSLNLLGLSNSKISPSSSLSPFLLSLPSTFSGTGGQYAGLDVSFLSIGTAINPNAQSIGGSYDPTTPLPGSTGSALQGRYLLARTRLDLGLTNGQSNSDVTKQQLSGVALGVSTSLLPNDNPLQTSAIQKAENRPYFVYCLGPISTKAAAIQNDMEKNPKGQSLSHIEADQGDVTALLDTVSNGDTTKLKSKLVALKGDSRYSSVKPTAGFAYNNIPASVPPGDLRDELNDVGGRMDAARKSAQVDYANAAIAEGDLAKPIAACAKGATVIAGSQADLSIGVGARDSGEAGHLARLDSPGGAAWLSWRMPILQPMVVSKLGSTPLSDVDIKNQDQIDAINAGDLNYFLFGGSLHTDLENQFTTGNKTTPVIKANEYDAWAGFQWITSNWQLGAQGGYTSVMATQSAQKSLGQSGGRWLAQANYKIGSTGMWIGASYGTANGTTTKLDDKTFTLNIYFAPPSALSLFGK